MYTYVVSLKISEKGMICTIDLSIHVLITDFLTSPTPLVDYPQMQLEEAHVEQHIEQFVNSLQVNSSRFQVHCSYCIQIMGHSGWNKVLLFDVSKAVLPMPCSTGSKCVVHILYRQLQSSLHSPPLSSNLESIWKLASPCL